MLYIDDEDVRDIISDILFIYAFIMPSDLTNAGIGFMLRILQFEKFVFKTYIYCYYGVSITLAYFLCFKGDLSYIGIWIGMLTGFYCMSVIVVTKLIKADWAERVEYVSKRMKESKNGYVEM